MAEWNFADDVPKIAAEIHLAGSEQRDENGLVLKEILREGEWPVIPTNFGRVNKPLRVVRNGKSDQDEGIIALEELVENFEAGAISNVQIPLSDTQQDHKNTTRLNTGFVRSLRIEDKEDGARLIAEMDFTEPDVRERTLRGTYADVSCGIPWQVSSRGKDYGACLEHVAITNKPFIDSLGPFLAMSAEEQEELQVDLFSQTMKVEEENEEGQEASEASNGAAPEAQAAPSNLNVTEKKTEPLIVSYETQKSLLTNTLNQNFNLSGSATNYTVKDLTGDKAIITNTIAGTTWTVPYALSGTATNPVIDLSGTGSWQEYKEQPEGEEIDEAPVVPVKTTVPRSESFEDELEAARRLRELRFSDSSNNNTKETNMTLSAEELERLELSDETRAVLSELLNENADLKARSREQDVDSRIEQLKELGLNERPSALKLYREVALSDDSGPAVVLLSDDGKEKEKLSATTLLDRFIEAIKGSDEKVRLSDQALVTGDDDKPPANADDEKKPFEERLASVRADLGIKEAK